MNVFGYAQRLGKSLMLPIAVLPIAGLLLRLGQADLLDIAWMNAAGSAIFDNLALLFGIGIAVGLSKDEHGAAGLAGAIGFFVLTGTAETIDASINMGVFAGIIAGIIAGHSYNQFHGTVLPPFLAFFGGKRLVPIMTGIIALLAGVAFGFIWPPIQGMLDAFGNAVVGSGAIGQFTYGFMNRMLIPIGLHHVLNTIFWFEFGSCVEVGYTLAASADALKTCVNPDMVSTLAIGSAAPDVVNGGMIAGSEITAIAAEATKGDLWRFFSGDPVAGSFMNGFFPIMMFGLPGAALAMTLTAHKGRKAETAGVLGSLALTAFLTGVTEPIEFMFVFLAPALYAAHAVMTGLSLVVANALGTLHGFTFSAGLFDFLLNWGIATKPAVLLLQGIVWFFLYFVVFYFAIKVFNLKTPGREDQATEEAGAATAAATASAGGSDYEQARQYMKSLGGASNIKSIDACITRLRLTLENGDAVNEAQLKALGAKGVVRLGSGNVQVILGPQAEIIAGEMKKIPASDDLAGVVLP